MTDKAMSDYTSQSRLVSPLTQEARQVDRIRCRVPVQLQTSAGRLFPAICTDVNDYGIGIDCEQLIGVGHRVEVLFGDQQVPMLTIYRMDNHYGLSALERGEELLRLLPEQG
jgi:hypothetical protein